MKKTFYLITFLVLATLLQLSTTPAYAAEWNLFDEKFKTTTHKDWKISFNIGIDSSSVNEGTVYVVNQSDDKVNTSIEVDGSEITVLAPEKGYEPGMNYSLKIQNLSSKQGVEMTTNTQFDFTTERAAEEDNATAFKNNYTGENSFEGFPGTKETLLKEYGEPHEKIKTSTYVHWIYKGNDYKNYIQFGLKGDQVQRVFTTSPNLALKGVSPTQTISSLDGRSFEGFQKEDEGGYVKLNGVNENENLNYYFIGNSNSDYIWATEIQKDPNNKIHEVTREDSNKAKSKLIFHLINAYRAQHNLNTLEIDERLENAAQNYAEELTMTLRCSHTSIDGETAEDRFKKNGISDDEYSQMSEIINCGYGGAAGSVTGFINSPKHRSQLLSEFWTHIGVGSYYSKYVVKFYESK